MLSMDDISGTGFILPRGSPGSPILTFVFHFGSREF
jgi:hypothetical protein